MLHNFLEDSATHLFQLKLKFNVYPIVLNVYISEIYEADKKAYGLQSKTYDENYGCPCEEAGRGCITLPLGSRWPFPVLFFNVPQEFWEILVGSQCNWISLTFSM